jgi:hypothetical protein
MTDDDAAGGTLTRRALARETGARGALAAGAARARARALPRAASAVFAAGAGCVTDVAVDPVGERWLLVGDTRARVRLYDCNAAPRAEPRGAAADAARAHARAVTSVAWWARDGGLFVSGGADGRLVAWDARDAGALRPAARIDVLDGGGGAGRVHAVAVSPVGSAHALVACGTEAPGVRLVDLASGAATQTLPAARDAILAVAWSPAHEFVLAAGARDGSLRLYDVRRGGDAATLATLDAHATPAHARALFGAAAAAGAAAPLPAGAAASLGVSARAGEPAPAGAAAAHGAGGVNGLLWAPPPRGGGGGFGGGGGAAADAALFSTGADGALRGWGVRGVDERGARAGGDAGDVLRGRAAGAAAWCARFAFAGARNAARRCVRFAAAGGRLFHPGAAGADEGAVGVWDAARGERLGLLRGHAARVNALAWRADGGGQLFSGADDGTVIRWTGALAARGAAEEDA